MAPVRRAPGPGHAHAAGGRAPDRIDIDASVQRVDAAGRELVLRVLVTPRGALAEAGGISPAENLTLQTSSSVRGDLTFPAHSRIATVDVPVTLTGGPITDHPFDAYETDMELHLVRRRMGLTWPALGWMAATLFALAAFRNTAPGAPPIGSLLDYLAFFWAETLIAFCVIVVVVRAVRAEDPPPPRGAPVP
ncbi:DUF4436 family protein [Streptomyces flavochromogenes]|uniref:DUF4436 family protein n=1 Tax=Streptomyces flavochromogenes TaxID=68199 RepID=UPI00315841C9